jgi:membrane fusion protein (multidrug efflux system)
MMRPFTRSLILVTITLAALACAKKEAAPAQPKTPPPLPADVAKVSAAANATSTASSTATDGSGAPSSGLATEAGGTIVATGEFVSPVRSELAAKLPGRVGKMYVDEGAMIQKGQPLLELETDYTRINLQRAEADAQRAAAAEADALRDLERKKELIAKDSIPRAVYDRSASTYDQAKAAHASAVAQAAMYRQQMSDSVLRSPIDGVVAEKRTDVGQRLGDATVALVVVQTSPLKLRFRIPEKYLTQVHRGEEVKATADPYPGEVFAGRVTVVGGVVDPSTRSFTVETEFPNRDGKLRPGLFARVEMLPKG